MAVWTLHGNGKTIEPGEVVAPDERLGWGRTISMGMQHVVAMFGATFLVPIITKFPPATTLFFSAIGTVLFLVVTGNRLPSYLGSSFAFISPIVAATSGEDGSMGRALFGVLVAGVLLAVVGGIVHMAGSGWLNAFMPPVMTGTIVMMIGFNLAGAAWKTFGDDGQISGGMAKAPLTAWITIIAVVIIAVLFRGLIGRLAVLLGVACGYVAALIQGQVDFEKISAAPWFGLPEFTTPEVDWVVVPMFLPVVLVLVAENVGHVKSVALMTGRDYDRTMGRALLADGVATTFAALGGGSGTTTYAENIGVMAATKIYSTAVYWVAAGTALFLSLIPKFGQAVATVPPGVIGGAGVVLYGMIGLLGARIWVENKVDFARPVNLFPAAAALILAIADATFMLGDVKITGIAVGTITAFALFHGMRGIAKWRGTDVAA
ncbi:MAG: NCS2 family nucleobase:cation symporter [Bifidobacteriaceae bacterium]|jgi:uracil-xanthine permease|nr:NCS2 family nucleobase:cation symporter [Bifidobacteriaceae bacterium]